MISELVQTILKKVPESYPHLQYPSVLRARVTGVSEDGEWEEKLEITDDNGTRDSTLRHKVYRYTLRIIDENANEASDFPAVPDVVSRMEIKIGETVAVALMSGRMEPYILGVCE